jgi:hypothetical protein
MRKTSSINEFELYLEFEQKFAKETESDNNCRNGSYFKIRWVHFGPKVHHRKG